LWDTTCPFRHFLKEEADVTGKISGVNKDWRNSVGMSEAK